MITKLFETKIEFEVWVYYLDEQTKNICWMKKKQFLNKFEKIGGNND